MKVNFFSQPYLLHEGDISYYEGDRSNFLFLSECVFVRHTSKYGGMTSGRSFI